MSHRTIFQVRSRTTTESHQGDPKHVSCCQVTLSPVEGTSSASDVTLLFGKPEQAQPFAPGRRFELVPTE